MGRVSRALTAYHRLHGWARRTCTGSLIGTPCNEPRPSRNYLRLWPVSDLSFIKSPRDTQLTSSSVFSFPWILAFPFKALLSLCLLPQVHMFSYHFYETTNPRATGSRWHLEPLGHSVRSTWAVGCNMPVNQPLTALYSLHMRITEMWGDCTCHIKNISQSDIPKMPLFIYLSYWSKIILGSLYHSYNLIRL